ncbi:MAG: aromatic aminobenezylarsenical efflux permease ArsG family transporter [Planctomycetaceae bacterium]|nr:aromatic aminobenezylarsenical efflux permease ArsG family transporter [Planctomycetaceae bacterium]
MSLFAVMSGVFWLGLLTAVSPCPLATNIAAISFLGRHVGSTRRVLGSALLYTLGRTLVYVVLGAGLLWGFHALAGGQGDIKQFASPTSRYLQHYGNLAMGPALLLVGMILMGLIELNLSTSVSGAALQQRLAKGGVIWALPLGMLFALAFCPPSIALFLSALVLSLEHHSPLLPPLVYGIGTAAPVVAFAFLIAFAGGYVGKAFNRLTQIEKWIRTATGIVFIAAGVYYCLTHIYGVRFVG